ncbi:molybdopterin molybdotransferase MoeA [Methylobacterium sp. Leaf112]|uniref:molybdopterin molybdotransferase MoeA n=1 Tax=Methylobacterium sp. Leaf112 TaxID=1736258 RepID=UPI0006F9F655|nr:gephyrin-like molybdotransferase Glp [Methylobacterium sp. Leaf112]KQP61932.1 molybdopterin biosynthesis protein MoeA [Methylobacterium sp. Leaf112]
MAQLTDSSLVGRGRSLALSLDEAVARVAALPVRAGIESVSLGEADGRVAAHALTARRDVPPFDNSAVDGYAVRAVDLAATGETRLPVRGRIAAGQTGIALPGTAMRIFTGAPMPEGTDTVFMQEDVRRTGDEIVLPAGLAPGANCRQKGEDVGTGQRIVAAGHRLTPADIGLAVAAGHGRLDVRRRLLVGLFSTGDELAEPGAALEAGAIHDSNRPMLAALLRRLGADVRDLGILRDRPETLGARLAAEAGRHDCLITTGGVSVGEEDHVRPAIEAVGRLDFWRLAIKPGRPVAMGDIAGTPFVGLPGNPVAAYVTLLFVVRPLLARLGGWDSPPPLAVAARAAFDHAKKAGRREILRVGLRRTDDGTLEAVRPAGAAAGGLLSLAASDGLAVLSEDLTAVRVGDGIAVYPHTSLA